MLSEKVEFSDQNYSESLLATLVYHYVQRSAYLQVH